VGKINQKKRGVPSNKKMVQKKKGKPLIEEREDELGE